ncbi:hypothetical protein AGR7A_Cc270013 [Agrobacterium deltaense NCPPB 1641]|uniref:Uncharacterized protein n=1 Tax=Agrobacterium deltaense NCPPB 1641 TaxID=1183425 RepID=A0A1S7TNF1_9HYPH|nr:hypothetical protein AGR7A_Cc270013 [Agrobacterium deltaense NCPPB 1641]
MARGYIRLHRQIELAQPAARTPFLQHLADMFSMMCHARSLAEESGNAITSEVIVPLPDRRHVWAVNQKERNHDAASRNRRNLSRSLERRGQ